MNSLRGEQMNYKENARKNHRNGFNCAMSVYSAHDILRKSCNDYVGDAARLIEEALG